MVEGYDLSECLCKEDIGKLPGSIEMCWRTVVIGFMNGSWSITERHICHAVHCVTDTSKDMNGKVRSKWRFTPKLDGVTHTFIIFNRER